MARRRSFRRRRYSPRKAIIRYRTRYAPRIRRYGSRAGKILGLPKLSIKNTLAGALGYLVVHNIQPLGGTWKPQIDKIATGIALNAVKMDNSDFVTVGIKEAIAKAVGTYVLPAVGVNVATDF